MIDDNPFAPRVVTCLSHRKERATHLCTDLNCTSSPILCPLCLGDHRLRAIHPHESSIRPIPEAIDLLTSTIRNQSKSIQMIYERTIGGRECEIIKFNLQKGGLLFQQLDGRFDNMKMQLQGEMDQLIKQFQQQIQLQKQQFHRRFDEYKRLFYSNLDILKKDNAELIGYMNTLKFYNNANSFTLKLINQTERKSQEWFLGQKKVLQRVAAILDNPSFSSTNGSVLSRATKSNLFIFPYWKGEKRDQAQVEREFRVTIRSAAGNWFQIPDLMDLQRQENYPPSNKYISYPISV